ncbi:hypothetical protein ACFQE8_04665 [Salinirubellus sp. GCM10025818]|uniref:DUF7502 family protein n=1 Tax=Salinirubellus TaxID=2162630 RepID=UPI0030D5782B
MAEGSRTTDERLPVGEARERVERAVGRVRREGYKAAAIQAVVDLAVVTLAVNLGLTVLGLDLPGPEYTPQAIAAGVGLLVGVVEFVIRVRVPLVERFEEVNPEVREALRTARDAARAGSETRVAARLYEDVLAGLRRASSADLVSTRRVAGGVVLVIVLSAATVQASVVGIDLTGGPEDLDTGNEDRDEDDYSGLEDGEEILGEETDVDGGDDDLDAVIGGSAGGEEDSETQDRSYEGGGFSASGSYDAQQSGFAPADEVENADIIREYNVRIRQNEET